MENRENNFLQISLKPRLPDPNYIFLPKLDPNFAGIVGNGKSEIIAGRQCISRNIIGRFFTNLRWWSCKIGRKKGRQGGRKMTLLPVDSEMVHIHSPGPGASPCLVHLQGDEWAAPRLREENAEGRLWEISASGYRHDPWDRHAPALCESVFRAELMTGGGWCMYASANFERLVFDCVNAKFCNHVLIFRELLDLHLRTASN